LVLTELIGSGGDRDVWRHPVNPALCVKVAKPSQERAQNDIDYDYSSYLARRRVHGPHLTRMHGWVETNRGRGLVFDLVQQPDGTPCPTLPQALRAGMLDEDAAHRLISEAFDWMIANKVVLGDCGVSNFVVRDGADGSRHLVVVDGLGARHFGFKYWIRRRLAFLARRKTRQFRAKALRLLHNPSSAFWTAR
jgi:hypothetical protein